LKSYLALPSSVGQYSSNNTVRIPLFLPKAFSRRDSYGAVEEGNPLGTEESIDNQQIPLLGKEGWIRRSLRRGG